MNFSYSRIWDDTAALLRQHATLIVALAGVFLFLPALLVGYFLPMPEAASFAELVRNLNQYLERNWHWMMLESLVNMVGYLAILYLVLGRAGTSVAAAIAAGAALLPFYFLASLVAGFAIGLAALLFLVPGLYLFGRLAPFGPVMVAEARRSPIEALRRTFDLTRGRGWAVFGLVLLVAVAAITVMTVVTRVFSLIFLLAAGRDLGGLLSLIVSSATGAALTVVLSLLYAAIYRALAGGGTVDLSKGI